MEQKWIGCSVSLNCGESGTYQGEVNSINTQEQTLILKKAFMNGTPFPESSVALRWRDIQKLTILKTASEVSTPVKPAPSTVSVRKPVAKRFNKTVSENIAGNKLLQNNSVVNKISLPHSSSAHTLGESAWKTVSNDHHPSNFNQATVQHKKERPRQHRWTDKDEACFGEPIKHHIMNKEFDFEKNLALFNKKAVYDEINAQRPDLVRQTDRQVNYRHNENVLAATPARFGQIVVPSNCSQKEYVTDMGLVVPSITSELRRSVLNLAEDYGFTFERQSEIVGRAATELILQLLGGAHRLNPQNSHQKPSVIVMCGSNRPGAMGVNTARQLAAHGVTTFVYLMDPIHVTTQVSQELTLYKLTGQKASSNVQELPTGAVDLVVIALADERTVQLNRLAASWVLDCRAPLLAIDPPPTGTPGIPVKLSIIPVLPLPHCAENGRLYLVNLAIPQKVYSELGIHYKSPFGPKFVMPLHAD